MLQYHPSKVDRLKVRLRVLYLRAYLHPLARPARAFLPLPRLLLYLIRHRSENDTTP